MPINHKSHNETHIGTCAGARSRRSTENGFRFPAPQAGKYSGSPQAGRQTGSPQAGRYSGAPTALVAQAA